MRLAYSGLRVRPQNARLTNLRLDGKINAKKEKSLEP